MFSLSFVYITLQGIWVPRNRPSSLSFTWNSGLSHFQAYLLQGSCCQQSSTRHRTVLSTFGYQYWT